MLIKRIYENPNIVAVAFLLPERVKTYQHSLLNTGQNSLAIDNYFISVW